MAAIFMSLRPRHQNVNYIPLANSKMRFILNCINGVAYMVLLSLGPRALIALLHTERRPDCDVPDPFWLFAAVEPLGSAPYQTEETPTFLPFLQSSN